MMSTDRRLGGWFAARYARRVLDTSRRKARWGIAIWGTLNADASRAGLAEAGAAGLLQWLEPRATGRQIRDAGEYGEDVAAPQYAGYPGMSRALALGLQDLGFRIWASGVFGR